MSVRTTNKHDRDYDVVYYYAKGIAYSFLGNSDPMCIEPHNGLCYFMRAYYFEDNDDEPEIIIEGEKKCTFDECEFSYQVLLPEFHRVEKDRLSGYKFVFYAVDKKGKIVDRIEAKHLLLLLKEKLMRSNSNDPMIKETLRVIEKLKSVSQPFSQFTVINGKPAFVVAFECEYFVEERMTDEAHLILLASLDFNRKTVDVDLIYLYKEMKYFTYYTLAAMLVYNDIIYLPREYVSSKGSSKGEAIVIDKINILKKELDSSIVYLSEDTIFFTNINMVSYINNGKPYLAIRMLCYDDGTHLFVISMDDGKIVKHRYFDKRPTLVDLTKPDCKFKHWGDIVPCKITYHYIAVFPDTNDVAIFLVDTRELSPDAIELTFEGTRTIKLVIDVGYVKNALAELKKRLKSATNEDERKKLLRQLVSLEDTYYCLMALLGNSKYFEKCIGDTSFRDITLHLHNFGFDKRKRYIGVFFYLGTLSSVIIYRLYPFNNIRKTVFY